MRIVCSRDWRTFFGETPYPFDLSMVESRDGDDGRAAFVAEVLGSTPQRVLDLGCGHGRHLTRLTTYGHVAVGVDLSARAAALAVRRPGNPGAVAGSLERLPFRSGSFDAAVSLYTSLGYAGTDLAGTLREAARVVRPRGALVVDVGNGDRARIGVGWERVRRGVALWWHYPSRRHLRQRNLVASTDVIGLYGLTHLRFTVELVTEHLTRQGEWRVRDVYGDFTGASWQPSSDRIVVVACRAG